MGFSRLLLFFYPTFLQLLAIAMAQAPPLFYVCGESGNFTTKSTYQSNLDRTLASLSSDTKITSGFYNDSSGQNANKVNAIALCRGDKKPETCRSCMNNSSKTLRNLCPNQKEAIAWRDDDCMLRYSNRSIFGKMEFDPKLILYNINNVSEVAQFNQALNPLLASLTSRAAAGDSLHKFATGHATTENNETIYALAQCTPDLSKEDCSNCLNNATGLFPQCCGGKQGARVVTPSCHFRYEIELFYDSGVEEMPPSPTPLPVLPPPQRAPQPGVALSPPAALTPQTPSGESSTTGIYNLSLCEMKMKFLKPTVS